MSPSQSWASLTTRTVKIVSIDTSLHGTTQTFTVTTTLNNNSAQTDNGYTFEIVLSDPCRAATLNSPTLSNMSVDDGSSATLDFTDASDTHYLDYGAIDFCGSRTFTIEDTSGNAVSWLSVALKTGSTYTITAAPTSTNTEL